MSNPICDTLFDSRDLIAYREELEGDILDAYVEWAESQNEYKEDVGSEELDIPYSYEEIEFVDEEVFINTCLELIEEHRDIVDFIEELEGYGDFIHGETIIHSDFFTEAMREQCEDIGDIPKNLPSYIENNIDWEEVASDLMADYTSASYGRSTYYMRA